MRQKANDVENENLARRPESFVKKLVGPARWTVQIFIF
jgi:hypothetical protein